MTPFETFLFYDSCRRPENVCPADALTILKVSGKLDYPRFRSAILDASAKNFAACHVVDFYENGIIEWSETEKWPEIHYFQGKPTSETVPRATINVLRESGIRFWIYDEPEKERAEIWYHFHHVTTDALGSFLFLNEILLRYAGATLPKTPVFTEKDVTAAANIHATFPLSCCACRQILAYFTDFLNPFRLTPLELRDSRADGTSQLPSLIQEGKWEATLLAVQNPVTSRTSVTSASVEHEIPQNPVTSRTSVTSASVGRDTSPSSPIMPALFHTFKEDFTRMLRYFARKNGVSFNNLVISAVFRVTARM
ncbi:MAG: hypothetical protein Q4C70_02360 [Planctomycetia bacterium]|nr:hypothetical protein [Planctomycetia bacterium]